jgi:hypothetical protein
VEAKGKPVLRESKDSGIRNIKSQEVVSEKEKRSGLNGNFIGMKGLAVNPKKSGFLWL